MAVSTITAAIATLRKLSADNGNVSLESTAGIVEGWEAVRTTEQLTREEKTAATAAKPQMAEIFAANPDAELDEADLAQRLGMPDKQGSRSYVRHHWRQLQIAYKKGANGSAEAAE